MIGSFSNIPKPDHLIEFITFKSFKCELFCNDILMSNGTCFLFDIENKRYLISNWHLFAGINSETGKHLHPSGFSPTHIKVYYPHVINPNSEVPFLYQLGNNLVTNEWKWLEHSKGRSIDLGALEIASIPTGAKALSVGFHEMDQYCNLRAGVDVFVCGFPLGLGHGNTGALWKRGSIASEPFLNHNKLPRFLIDTATRVGMSGSPVYVATNFLRTPDPIPQPGDPEYSRPFHTSPYYTFVGVYSGRVGEDELSAQLGIVWQNSLIEEIITNGKKPEY